MRNFGFVFLADKDYLPGIRVAVHSLRKFHAEPIYIYTNDREVRKDAVLNDYDCSFHAIFPSSFYRYTQNDLKHFNTLAVSQKINVFRSAFGHDFIFYNDADVLFLRPIQDSLLDLPTQFPGCIHGVGWDIAEWHITKYREFDLEIRALRHLSGGHFMACESLCNQTALQQLLSNYQIYGKQWFERTISEVFNHCSRLDLHFGKHIHNGGWEKSINEESFCVHYSTGKPWEHPGYFKLWEVANNEVKELCESLG